jgi:hypothetical protein
LVVMALPQQELRPRLATRVSTGSGQGVPHAAQVSQPA